MTDGYLVDCQALGIHADTVAAVADRLEKISARARPVSDEAFGVIGRPVAGSLVATGGAVAGAIAALARAARGEEARLRGTVEAYRRREAEQVCEFDGIHVAGGPR